VIRLLQYLQAVDNKQGQNNLFCPSRSVNRFTDYFGLQQRRGALLIR